MKQVSIYSKICFLILIYIQNVNNYFRLQSLQSDKETTLKPINCPATKSKVALSCQVALIVLMLRPINARGSFIQLKAAEWGLGAAAGESAFLTSSPGVLLVLPVQFC